MGINLDYTVEDLFVNKEDLNAFLCQVCLESIIDFKPLTKKTLDNSQVVQSLEFEALQCRNGHLSCHDCWNKQLAIKKECPTCKVKTEIESLSRNIFLENTFRKNYVYCPYLFKESRYNNELVKDDLGCRSKVTVEELEGHLKNCPFKFSKCPNNKKKCHVITRKNLLASHNEVCDYVFVLCERCDEPVEKCELKKHRETVCTGVKEQCTSCSEEIGRSHIAHHIEHECKKIIVDCVYKLGGCNERVERGSLKEHLTKYNSHLTYIQNMFEKEKQRFEEMTNNFKALSLINSQLEKRISYLETTVKLNKDSSTSNLQRFVGKWTINNWDKKLKDYPSGKSFNSPFFFIGSYKFFVMLYPNGNSDARNFVSIFLYKILDQPTNVKYSLEAKNHDPSKNYKNSHTNYFTTNNGNGWFRFIDNKVLSNGFYDNNQLVINIRIKILPKEETIVTE